MVYTASKYFNAFHALSIYFSQILFNNIHPPSNILELGITSDLFHLDYSTLLSYKHIFHYNALA
jgi:hypothetical protein